MIFLFVLSLLSCHALVQAVDVGKVGGSCNDADPKCDDHNAKCDGTNVCRCNDGFNPPTGADTCAAIPSGKVNAACSDSKPCTDANSACKDGYCACNSGCTGNKGDDSCVPEPGKIGGSCKATTPHCDDDANAKCESNVCTCNPGYTTTPGAATCDMIGGATATSFPSLLLFVAMTSVAVVIVQ